MIAKEVIRLNVAGADFPGVSLSIHEDTALLGSLDPAAFVFRFDGRRWWEDRLTVPGAGAAFHTVSIHGDLALVGSPPSLAYLFRYDGALWVHEATFHGELGAPNYVETFGNSVAVEDDVAVVAAPPSAVYVFRFNGRRWDLDAKFEKTNKPKVSGQAILRDTGFGVTVALDGDRILLSQGATMGDSFDGVYVYRYDGARWRHEGTLVADDPPPVFHGAIALDRDRALVDSDYEDIVYVFGFNGNEWVQEAILAPKNQGVQSCSCLPIPSEDRDLCDDKEHTPNFGVSVALDGDIALIGANLDDEGGTDAGAVYVFRYTGKRWKQELKILGDNREFCGVGFGRVVALHENYALVRSQLVSGGATLYRLREAR
jgi:hypothetical protein